MNDFVRSLRSNVGVAAAVALMSMAIAVNLGPVWFFATWFVSGCGYIIHTALKR